MQPAGTINRRILVVDDTPSIHRDYRKILCPEADGTGTLSSLEATLFGSSRKSMTTDFDVDFSFQGQDALALVETALAEGNPYAMAFVDMRMPPGWDGLETIERLWQADPLLQVALCTAYSDHSWEVIAQRLELADRLLILKKPFDAIEIHQMACTLTAKWQLSHEAAIRMRGLERLVEERALELLQLSRQLRYDILTELPNQTALHDCLSELLAEHGGSGERLAAIFLGIDRFRRINHALGNAMGDELLKSVADFLSRWTGKAETVFRIGGDQFVVLLPRLGSRPSISDLAESLLASLRMPQTIAGQSLSITASLGIGLYPDHGVEPASLLRSAEVAMHAAKADGRDGLRFFSAEMNAQARQQQSLEAGLRQALEHQEFVLNYQPKVLLETGAIVGAEALIRWNRPGHGMVSPALFIPFAEESGLIVPISRWVMHEACRQARAWQDAGLSGVILSLNVSALDFHQKDFLQGLRQALEESGIEAGCLELEITEGALMRDIQATIGVLYAIKEMGLRLAIDDFGTGYSSLSYLRHFPVDVLKIDQSFVRDIATDANDAALVRAIISMGRSLGLGTIAEGVETREQLAFLREHHCDEGQGYLFGRPVDAEAFKLLLQQEHAGRPLVPLA